MALAPSFAVFRHRAYLQFWVMRICNGSATQMLATAIGWQVYDLARIDMTVKESAFLLGFVGLAQFLPLLVLSPIGGVVADRLNRKLILVTSLGVRAGVVVWLFVITGFAPSAALPAIFVAASVLGGLNAFTPAAASALLPRLVPRAELPQAIALNSLAFQGAAIAGPAIGGGLLYAGGLELVYGSCVALLGLAALLIGTTPTPKHERVEGARTLAMIVEGLRYVRDNKIVLGAISLDLIVVLFGGATALLPVFARDILDVGPAGLGLMRAAPALGAACVAVILATRSSGMTLFVWLLGFVALAPVLPWLVEAIVGLGAQLMLMEPPRLDDALRDALRMTPVVVAVSIAMMLAMRPLEARVGRWMLVAVAVYGAAMLGFAGSRFFWMSLLALAVTGAADMISVYVRQSLIQLATPDAMRGRVASVSFIFISASNELGEFESGIAARFLGPIGAVFLGGSVAIASAGAWLKLFPQLARTDRFEDAAHEELHAPAEPAAKSP